MLAGTSVKIVGEAIDAKSTLTLAKKHKPAVVLLDVAIPGGDAFELAGTLSKSLPGSAPPSVGNLRSWNGLGWPRP